MLPSRSRPSRTNGVATPMAGMVSRTGGNTGPRTDSWRGGSATSNPGAFGGVAGTPIPARGPAGSAAQPAWVAATPPGAGLGATVPGPAGCADGTAQLPRARISASAPQAVRVRPGRSGAGDALRPGRPGRGSG
jgi:hypothetical protein